MLARCMSDPSTRTPTEQVAVARPPHSAPLIVAVTAAWAVSLMGYYAQAQLLGPLMQELGLAEGAVGWLFSVENAALALSTLAAAGPLARWSRSATASIGCLLVVSANLTAAFAGSYEALVAARLLMGVGAGFAGASGTAAAASAREPERIFAAVAVSWGLLSAGEPTVLAYAIEPFGSRGGYLCLAGASLLLMPALRLLPRPRESAGTRPGLLGAPNRSLALAAMLALLVFETGQGGVYTFVAQIGERCGLDEYEVGRALTGTGLFGLIGGLIAAQLGGRFGRRWPIAIGLSLNIAAAVGLALGNGATTFVALMFLWNAAYYFVVPFLMGLVAALDDLGRWAVVSDGAWTLGDALGPGLAGTLVERGGYLPLSAMALLAGLACLVTILGVSRRFEARPASSAAS